MKKCESRNKEKAKETKIGERRSKLRAKGKCDIEKVIKKENVKLAWLNKSLMKQKVKKYKAPEKLRAKQRKGERKQQQV